LTTPRFLTSSEVGSGVGVPEAGEHLTGHVRVTGVDLVHRRLDYCHVSLELTQLGILFGRLT